MDAYLEYKLVTEDMPSILLNILKNRGINILTIILTFLAVMSCNDDDAKIDDDTKLDIVAKVELPPLHQDYKIHRIPVGFIFT
jgi:hypothetical protein